jgi:NTE family protein
MRVARISIVSIFVSLLMAGCQSRPLKNEPKTGGVGSGGVGGQPVPRPPLNQTPPQQTSDGGRTEPILPRPTGAKVAVILGPGGAKSFAHVGVLKALQQQRIPVEKVVGLEWGALMAALYAQKGQSHDLEWKLYKMEQKNLPRPKGFFSRGGGETNVKVMEDFLTEAFGKDEATKTKLRFACPTRSIYSGVVSWQDRGLLKDVVKRCLAYPPVFQVQGTFFAGASQAREAIELLTNENFGTIILVNVLGSALPVAQDGLLDNSQTVILWQEVRRALLEASQLNVETISVDTSAYPILQFESKRDLVLLGEVAGQKAAAALVHKYGF